MKWELSKSNLIFIIVIIILLFFIVLDKGLQKINDSSPVEEIVDTVYNYKVIDSIRYNIQVKDSIIYRIRYEYETKYIEAESLDDSSAVELFKALCTDDSLYGGEDTI